MARRPGSPVSVVIGYSISFCCAIIGACMLWKFTTTSTFDLLRLKQIYDGEEPDAIESTRYGACFFVFSWICSFLAHFLAKSSLFAVTCGFLAALVIQILPFQQMDDIRISLNDPTIPDSNKDDLRLAAAGGIVGYFGTILAFLLASYSQRTTKQASVPLVFAHICLVLSLIGVIVGSILLFVFLQDSPIDHDFDGVARDAAFGIAEIGIVVVFILVVGFVSRNPTLIQVATAFSALLGWPVIKIYFDFLANNGDSEFFQDTKPVTEFKAGSYMIWIAMQLTLVCALLTNYAFGNNTYNEISGESLA